MSIEYLLNLTFWELRYHKNENIKKIATVYSLTKNTLYSNSIKYFKNYTNGKKCNDYLLFTHKYGSMTLLETQKILIL